MSDETAPVNVRVDKDTKELAKERLDHGGLTEVVEEALSRVAHGEQTTERQRVKDHLQELRDERRDLKSERDDIESELDKIDEKIARAEERLDSLMEENAKYHGHLEMIEERLWDGVPIHAGMAEVKKAANAAGKPPSDVINDLKERNEDAPEDAFQQRDARQYNWKLDSDAWDARRDEPVSTTA